MILKAFFSSFSLLFIVLLRETPVVGALWLVAIAGIWIATLAYLLRRIWGQISPRARNPIKLSIWYLLLAVDLTLALPSFFSAALFMAWWADPGRFTGLDVTRPALSYLLLELFAIFNVYGQGYGLVVPSPEAAPLLLSYAMAQLGPLMNGLLIAVGATIKFTLF